MAREKVEEFVAVGRRKTSVARVRIAKGNGQWFINGKEMVRSKLPDSVNALLIKPLRVVDVEENINFRTYARGGGEMGQMQAIALGLARALEKMNPEWRSALKKEGLLTRDPRSKERKKPGQVGARKRFQFSKR
ncbi:MAG: 30S ribosomal protein S9 [Puniceicoccales bacterium]|jgi:small subunit ribosomal protein S9|nr:30S ribosomal protein S9 [Puniceicoccales bacterium]